VIYRVRLGARQEPGTARLDRFVGGLGPFAGVMPR
jgi:hypothetical protein